MRRLRHFEWAGLACLVAGIAIIAAVLCTSAHAAEKHPTIEPFGPSYFTFAGSTSDSYMDPSQDPNARARTGFMVPFTAGYQTVGKLLWRPEFAMEWMARRWPIGGDSSPIGENNEYRPQVGVTVAWADPIKVGPVEIEKARIIPWAHASNGQGVDAMSASMDASQAEVYAGWKQFELVLRGWYLLDTGSETAAIRDFINTPFWKNAGGNVQMTARFDAASVQAVLGLSQQDVYLQLPFRQFWSFSFFGWMHNGEADGIVDYASKHTSWGGGISFFDL